MDFQTYAEISEIIEGVLNRLIDRTKLKEEIMQAIVKSGKGKQETLSSTDIEEVAALINPPDILRDEDKILKRKIFNADDAKGKLRGQGFHEEDGRIASITFGVDSDFKHPVLTIGIDLLDGNENTCVTSGFANTFTLRETVRIIQATGVNDINKLVGKLCVCDVENITGSPSCFFKRLKEGQCHENL